MSKGHPKVDTIMVIIRTFIKGERDSQEFIDNYNTIYVVIEELIRETELQDDIIKQVKIAIPWMVKTLVHATDELHEGNYSDELKHAMAVNNLLEKI